MGDIFAGNLILTIADLLSLILTVYMWIIVAAALISWVSPDPYNPIVRFLYRVTNPVLRPIRRFIGNRLGPVDISPLIVVFIIYIIQRFLITSLVEIALKIK
jgi:YggT family protein